MGGGDVKILAVRFPLDRHPMRPGIRNSPDNLMSFIGGCELGWARVQEVRGTRAHSLCALDRRRADRHIIRAVWKQIFWPLPPIGSAPHKRSYQT